AGPFQAKQGRLGVRSAGRWPVQGGRDGHAPCLKRHPRPRSVSHQASSGLRRPPGVPERARVPVARELAVVAAAAALRAREPAAAREAARVDGAAGILAGLEVEAAARDLDVGVTRQDCTHAARSFPNWASSVEPVSARVELWPFETASITASK